MGRFFHTIKKVFFWSYARNTWQWDVLCVLILAFIFLTPKSWFETSELQSRMAHPIPVASTLLLLSPEVVASETDRSDIERRVRAMTGRPEAEVLVVRQRRDPQGKVVALEVDIR